MPTRSFQEIFDRHRGPYCLLGGGPGKGPKDKPTSAWLKSAGPRFHDVWTNEPRDDKDRPLSHLTFSGDGALERALVALKDNAFDSVSIWSDTEQQFVTTVTRRDLPKEWEPHLPLPTTTPQELPPDPEDDAREAAKAANPTKLPGDRFPSVRGRRLVPTAEEPKDLGPALRSVYDKIKELGAATVAEVVAAMGPDANKDAIASHASRLKKLGLIQEEAAA